MQLLSIKVAIFRYNKNKDWFSQITRLVFVYGKVCKGIFKNSATFKMELFATIRMLESCKEMLDYTVVKDYMIISTYQ